MTQPSRTARLSSKRSLAIVGIGGASTQPLPALGVVTLGRGAGCDVVIDDPDLDDKHVTLRLTPGSVEIIDCGTRKGTRVGAERIEAERPTPLPDGVSVTVGSTVFVIQQSHAAARPRRLMTHGYFEARVDEECARASRGGTPFAIIRARSTKPEAADQVAQLLGAWTRSLDVIGVYAPGRFEVLLTQTEESRAETLGAQIRAGFAAQGLDVIVDVCCYPRDGRSAEVLVDRGPFRDEAGSAQFEKVAAKGAPLNVGDESYAGRIQPMLERIAAGEISVLILGETGVGKEVMAHRIHALSQRRDKTFVALNCSALSETLLESELFGHEKGAFTGALSAKEGLLESAHGGTVFLDEIGEMSMGIQAKLLRVLEQREITRVGALKPRPIDVRFVSATNRDLEREIEAGRFRQDLYFRLNGITLSIPPLRERQPEIATLAETFIREAARRMGKEPRGLSRDALKMLREYPWPGNIRELRNMMDRAVLLSDGDVVRPEHLPTEKMRAVVPSAVPRHAPPPESTRFAPPAPPRTVEDPPPSSRAFESDDTSFVVRLRPGGEEERRKIVAALERCNGNQTAAAKLLGISRRTLVSRLSAFDLPRPRKREP